MKDMSLHLSEGDLHDCPDYVCCGDCKHYDAEHNECMENETGAVIEPWKTHGCNDFESEV